ncbi:hypothetical protein ONZ45_g11756 [Pleurotus djamor]|nr:hypothetical protein ONZ45_g11756 [Pleurotus djamor]
MSRPPINPEKTLAGITVDPHTLDRVIPESRRPDGTVRKQLKIRPGFTPQEDVRRFRGTRQAQMDAMALPKGHIVGWAPPSNTASKSGGSANAFPALGQSTASSSASSTKPLSKAAKKNAKRKEKRGEQKAAPEPVKDNWDDEDEDAGDAKTPAVNPPDATAAPLTTRETDSAPVESDSTELESKFSKLEVK